MLKANIGISDVDIATFQDGNRNLKNTEIVVTDGKGGVRDFSIWGPIWPFLDSSGFM